MCIHENTNSPKFTALAKQMKIRYGLEPLTLVSGRHNFSMFVTPRNPTCIERAAHDLRTWHPLRDEWVDYGFSDASAERLLGRGCYGERIDSMPMIYGRNVPDSLDLDEKDVEAVYRRCVESGYVAGVTAHVES